MSTASLVEPEAVAPVTRALAVEVKALHKTFAVGFFRKQVVALRGVDFAVRTGEIFGVLGPNGAGKTTAIKILLGLAFASSGTLKIFGEERPGPDAMRRLGYLPENPYVYQYLRAHEFLDLCGRLCGMSAAARKKRTEEMLVKVGLSHATDRPIGKFSKGMTQRIGLAQALLHDPELLILDEPMSGLDPIGRKEVRDLILEEKSRGKTILFTSHILTDVETLCDRVAILHRGRVTAYGALDTLLKPEVRRTELELEGVPETLEAELVALGGRVLRAHGDADARRLALIVEGESARAVVERAVAGGARLVALHEQRETLEDLFLRDALKDQSQL